MWTVRGLLLLRGRTGRALLVAASMQLTSCASGGGIFQAPKASGTIHARFVGTNVDLSSSSLSPTAVHNGFSIVLSEADYSAQFTATIVSFTAPATASCYTVQMDPSGTVATFTPRAAAPLSGAAGATSPCTPPSDDVEGVLFADQQQHSAPGYFKNT